MAGHSAASASTVRVASLFWTTVRWHPLTGPVALAAPHFDGLNRRSSAWKVGPASSSRRPRKGTIGMRYVNAMTQSVLALAMALSCADSGALTNGGQVLNLMDGGGYTEPSQNTPTGVELPKITVTRRGWNYRIDPLPPDAIRKVGNLANVTAPRGGSGSGGGAVSDTTRRATSPATRGPTAIALSASTASTGWAASISTAHSPVTRSNALRQRMTKLRPDRWEAAVKRPYQPVRGCVAGAPAPRAPRAACAPARG